MGPEQVPIGVFWQFSFFVRPPVGVLVRPPVGVQDELELLCYLASTERPAGSPLACVVGSLRPCVSPGPQD